MKRQVSVSLSRLACEGLAGDEGSGEGHVPVRAVRAIRYYLSDKGSGRPGWKYPSFMRGKAPGATVEVELSVDEDVWGSFEREAEAQAVSTERLAEHAVLYFVAEINSGRATLRILDDLDDA